MGLLDSTQENADLALSVMASQPLEPEKPKSKHSAWSTPFRAVAAGASEVMANTNDVLNAYGQVVAASGGVSPGIAPSSERKRAESMAVAEQIKTDGLDFRPESSKPLYNFSVDMRPDPVTAGKAEQLVFGFGKGITKAIGAGYALGPVSGALTFGTSEGITEAETLAREGVDKETRTKVGVVNAAINTAGMALPVAGNTLAKTAALAVVGGPASFIAQQQTTRTILENANYDEIAKQYDPLDPVGLTVATLLPAGFGAWAMRGARGVKKPAADATASKDAEVSTARPESASVATHEAVDAAMVHNLTLRQDFESQMGSMARGKDLSPEYQAIERRAYERVLGDTPGMVTEYFQKFGKTIDPDNVKAMFQEFRDNPALASALHEPSSYLSKAIYTEALRQNEGRPVVFTAGGGGSGKSEAMPVAMKSAGIGEGALTFDSTLSSFASATKKIDEALASNSPVAIVYTNNHVERAFDYAMTRDRVVPASVLSKAHVDASNTIRQLAEHYKDNPNVAIRVVNNHGALQDMRIGTIDDVFTYAHNDVERSLYERANQALESGSISAEKHAALLERSGRTEPGNGTRAVQEGKPGQDLGRPGERARSHGQGSGDPSAVVSSVLNRVEELRTLDPDMPVALREDGSFARLSDEVEAIRKQAQEGTEDTLGAQDAPLLKVAAECFLSRGG